MITMADEKDLSTKNLSALDDSSLNIAGGAGDGKEHKAPTCSKCGKEIPLPPHGFHHKHPPKSFGKKGHHHKLDGEKKLLCPECREAEKADKE